MPQVSAAVLRSTPSSTSASASIRRAAPLFLSPLDALRSSEAVRSSRVIATAAPIDAAPLKSQHRVRVSLIWESLTSHSFGPLVLVKSAPDALCTFGNFQGITRSFWHLRLPLVTRGLAEKNVAFGSKSEVPEPTGHVRS